jgi:hypothetical protein
LTGATSGTPLLLGMQEMGNITYLVQRLEKLFCGAVIEISSETGNSQGAT